MKNLLSKGWWHIGALAVFIIVAVAYFSPQFDGFGLKQHDIEQFKGMSNEISHFREDTGTDPLWTNAMFGGMPATQISVLHQGNFFKRMLNGYFSIFSSPAGVFLLHLICFYILGMFLRIKPLIAIFGAFVFALASYELIILQAGHNSKAVAVAIMPAVLGAFIYAFRTNWKWGAILSGLFMAFELSANHMQVTYYLLILLFMVGVNLFIEAVRKKEVKQYAISAGAIIGAYLLALTVNYGNIKLTNDYAKDTIRGGNDLTITPEGNPITNQKGGLDKDYITQWSYGIGESFTLISPYVKGSHSAALGNTPFMEIAENSDLPRSSIKGVADLPVYWGEQPMTSGPVYIGVITVFLALLGLVFLKGRLRWALFNASLVALALSWGKNFMPLTDFFIDYVPGYDKFRTVTIILVLVELCMPVLAILLLQKLYDNREEIKAKKKLFMYVSGGFFAFLLVVKFVGLGDGYSSAGDQRIIDNYRNGMAQQVAQADPKVLMDQFHVDANNPQQVNEFIDKQMESVEMNFGDLRIVRKDIFNSSMNRSLVVTFFGIGLLALFFFTALPSPYIIAGLIILTLADMIPVDVNYLGTETDNRGNYVHWVPKAEQLYPVSSLPADMEIMQNEIAMNPELNKVVAEGEKKGKQKAEELELTGTSKRRVIDDYKFAALDRATNFRVFDIDASPWQSSRASYFHKSMGGYHGAKLRNIQNVFEFHIARSNNKVLDMLNVKYFIQGGKANLNRNAMGNAWLVKTVKEYDTPDDEILALGKRFSLRNEGGGKLIVNDEQSNEAIVYGGEYIKYVMGADSIDVPLSNGLTKNLKAVLVMDVNGRTDLVPEATLQLDTANSFTKLVAIEVVDDFNPHDEAVMLKSEAKNLSSREYSGDGTVTMTSYAPNEIDYEADVKGKQLAVFSEVYYNKGWKAYVDGKEQPILKVNYLLRGLELTGGKHKIEFMFDLPGMKSATTISGIGSTILLLLAGFMGFQTIRHRKENKEEKAEADA